MSLLRGRCYYKTQAVGCASDNFALGLFRRRFVNLFPNSYWYFSFGRLLKYMITGTTSIPWNFPLIHLGGKRNSANITVYLGRQREENYYWFRLGEIQGKVGPTCRYDWTTSTFAYHGWISGDYRGLARDWPIRDLNYGEFLIMWSRYPNIEFVLVMISTNSKTIDYCHLGSGR